MTTNNDQYTYEYTLPVPLPGTREEMFHAMTDPQALAAWFAEQLVVELKVGGDFRFWGKHTFDTPDKSAANQQITTIEAPDRFGFSWHLMDRDTQVTWKLVEEQAEEETVTKIAVTHVFDSLPAGARAEAMIDDLWRIHTGNLLAFLSGQSDPFRPDFSDPNPIITCEQIIEASVERVFAVLTEPEYIKQWFPAPAPVVDPRVGGDYGFGFSFEKDGETVTAPPMKILAFEPNAKLSITWPDWRSDPTVPDQTVTWTLEDLGGKTRLTLQHSGFTRPTDVSDYPFGWQHFLGQIIAVATAE
ncbi:MAG: SRPBCC family protein [Lysobacterales bacterium]